MQLGTPLLAYALRQVIGESADQVAAFIAGRFADPSRALPRALDRANDRAWQALALALAGDGLLDQIKGFFAGGDVKGFRDQVRPFMEANRSHFEGTATDFRRACLAELKKARQAGALAAEPPDGAVARQAVDFRRFADPWGLIEGARQAVAAVADDLDALYPNLARLLREPTPGGGPPLLAAAFAYFFRREVATDGDLARELTFDTLQRLSVGQEAALDQAGAALTALGERFDDLLSEVLEQLAHLRQVTEETHAGVRRLEEQVEALRVEIRQTAGRNHVRAGEVSARLVVSITNEREQALLRRLRDEYRRLPAEVQHADDLLLLADSLSAAGLFGLARETHAEAAGRAAAAHNRSQEAEAHFKAYRDACEQHLWEEALRSLLEAARLDPHRFEPFPLRRYPPERILGAGGFGTVFLCHDTLARNEKVAIKALHTADLARSVEEVFAEAQTLHDLQHPAIIAVRHWDYADPGQTRPYIVMDYFPGGSLEEFVRERGALPPDGLVAVARQTAEALRAAHAQGVLHRDLKPDNVLVRKEGRNWQVKVIDFGLALRRQAIETSRALASGQETTLGGSVAGTLKYAPPEQMGELRDARGKPVPVGPYSDVYAFGKLCCYALFRTTAPKSRHWATSPQHEQWKGSLEKCIEEELGHRHESFEPVLQVLEALDPGRQAEEERRRERAEAERRQREVAEQQRREEEERRCQEQRAEGQRRQEQERQQQERARPQQEGETKPATLRLVRNTSAGAFISFKIDINGNTVGKLKYGGTLTLPVSAGRHHLRVYGGGAFFGAEEEIVVGPGDVVSRKVSYTLGGGVRLTKV
jgi:hypothetical protein